MFQNSFQNGNYFELFDPKTSADKQKNLYKLVNISNLNNKVFDKELKTYVLQFSSSNGKIVFPKEQKRDLYLIQQYIVFQVYFFHGQQWSMELVISDLNKTKRRIMISSTNHKLEIKPFFVKCPNPHWKQGCWNNFAIDLYSFMDAFKGQTYRCLDSITIMGHFKVRRIYTTNTTPKHDLDQQDQSSFKQISLLPKNFHFPPEIQQASLLTRYMGQTLSQINLYEPTQPSTKNNSSYLKSSKNNRMLTPKTQTTKSQKVVQVSGIAKVQRTDQERFLANTNGPQMLNRMRKREKYNQSSDSQSQMTQNIKTPQSTQKSEIKSKKKLIKTQVMPPKARSSVQKRPKIGGMNMQDKKQKQKEKLKSKLNPWRTNTKASETKKLSKQSEGEQSTPNTTQFKAKNEFTASISKGFDRKSDNFSESQYIELSQKFSTLTDGKFFNRGSVQQQSAGGYNPKSDAHEVRELENTEQIEENIEMETNSIYSSTNKKQAVNNVMASRQFIRSPEKLQMVNESICDSLDRRSPGKEFEQLGRQSYYGFGDRLISQYMRERERLYSPPMREREHTEEEEDQNNIGKDKQVELVYDPVLNCYYDHKTHTYYELKN